eukprot:NODE_188_length_2080_cov_199.693747_g148_i0.p1 GENE.NODE_188_length_2080_cov_199.693747_g148_i0~~NODE_188_length_2080_cov_199.693747_g148_i0.p1  ORF type:complete len:653 (-),score=174.06 NODE_188_length_2080_cov_199.693747_g148_i0:120-2012(-)
MAAAAELTDFLRSFQQKHPETPHDEITKAVNTFFLGDATGNKAHPCTLDKSLDFTEPLTFVVYGATGDLAKKKLYPAFGELLRFNMLPKDVLIVGYGRSKFTMEELWAKQAVNVKGTEEEKQHLLSRCRYFQGGYDNADDFGRLDALIREYAAGRPDNRVFFLSVPPTIFGVVCQTVKEKLMSPSGFTRVMIEKPFGRDAESFAELNKITSGCFHERQIYRIDHYLGKEVIMNFLTQRFANAIFEPMWNNSCVDHVQIRWTEDLGTGGRGGYFDQFGIIRDIMQNHLLQVLMFVAMERPDSQSGADIIYRKTKLLKAIRTLTLNDVVLGQYTGRTFQNFGDHLEEPGYLDDPTVPKGSRTPTFAAIKFTIDNHRWRGVPFVMLAGKGLDERMCEVRITFKPPPEKGMYGGLEGNELVMRIQPDEAIYFKVQTKQPGLGLGTTLPTVLDFSYKKAFEGIRIADAYERAFLNCAKGDQSLFVGTTELIEAWRIFSPLLHEIDEKQPIPTPYAFGSRGPPEADDMLRDCGARIVVTWEEYFAQHADSMERLKTIFNELATDGVLGVAAITKLLTKFNDGREPSAAKINRFLARVDRNGDCDVSWEEFCTGISSLLAREDSEDDTCIIPAEEWA